MIRHIILWKLKDSIPENEKPLCRAEAKRRLENLAGKIPGLDCISFGPELTEIHTPRERMCISSVARTWALLVETLKRMK